MTNGGLEGAFRHEWWIGGITSGYKTELYGNGMNIIFSGQKITQINDKTVSIEMEDGSIFEITSIGTAEPIMEILISIYNKYKDTYAPTFDPSKVKTTTKPLDSTPTLAPSTEPKKLDPAPPTKAESKKRLNDFQLMKANCNAKIIKKLHELNSMDMGIESFIPNTPKYSLPSKIEGLFDSDFKVEHDMSKIRFTDEMKAILKNYLEQQRQAVKVEGMGR